MPPLDRALRGAEEAALLLAGAHARRELHRAAHPRELARLGDDLVARGERDLENRRRSALHLVLHVGLLFGVSADALTCPAQRGLSANKLRTFSSQRKGRTRHPTSSRGRLGSQFCGVRDRRTRSRQHRDRHPRQARADHARHRGAHLRRPRAARGRAGHREDDPRPRDRAVHRGLRRFARPVHARPAADRRDRPLHLQPAGAGLRVPARARCSRTSSSSTRSTARCPRRSRPCSRRWQSSRSPWTGRPGRCPTPFLVLATQNPIEYEGTFPLPEAQLDRFFVRTALGYPDAADEHRIVDEQLGGHPILTLAAGGRRR